MAPTRKYPSGASKIRKTRRIEKLKNSQKGAMHQFLTKKPQNLAIEDAADASQEQSPDEELNDVEEDVEQVVEEAAEEAEEPIEEPVENPVEEPVEEAAEEPVEVEDADLVSSVPFNISDPRNWDDLDSKWKDLLVEKGPVRDLLSGKGPRDKWNRRFSSEFYSRSLPNGEKHHRDWLVYCKDLDRVFCFCCKLFKTRRQPSQLAHEGSNDWQHMSGKLKMHERSAEHICHMIIWVDLGERLRRSKTIDKAVQEQIMKEKEHWRKVLQRLFSIVKYLARQSLAFRGTNEKMYEMSNGNFMATVEMIAEWDSTMIEHLRRKENHEIRNHYLSHKVQNELIFLLGSEIKCAILKKIKEAKYFAVILDCTPDVSHQEQMTLILRCVDVTKLPVKVEEYFLEFLTVNDTTGRGLFEELQDVLKRLGLDIDNVRGQGYDNGSNMKGKHQGVQKRLLDINPRAFYTPCGCHSLNLTLSDIAHSCQRARDFFGVVQRIYTLFADSTKRWKILKDNIKEKGLTLKSLSVTRWESRIESIKPIVLQASAIREALLELADSETDYKIISQANCLAYHELGNFEFIVGMVIWFQILAKVNIVSKDLQSEEMLIDVAMDNVKGLISFFEEYRQNGFQKAVTCAKEIAAEMEIDVVFHEKKKKIRRKKQFFDEVRSESSEPTLSAEESFRIEYFVYIVDQTIGSLKRRFEEYEQYENIFGFLFTAERLNSLDENELKTSCNNLQQKLQHDQVSDVDSEDLFHELQLLQKHLPNEKNTAIAILNFLKRTNCYPSVCLAYRILLTVPVTVASAERSFSKLKLLKTYLRSTMTQDRLNALAMISIESEFLEKLDYERLIDDFAAKNARRSIFIK